MSTPLLNVRLEPALREQLEAVARARGHGSLSDGVREAIGEYVERYASADEARREIAESIDWSRLTPRAWRHLPLELAVLCPPKEKDRLRREFERTVRRGGRG